MGTNEILAAIDKQKKAYNDDPDKATLKDARTAFANEDFAATYKILQSLTKRDPKVAQDDIFKDLLRRTNQALGL